MANKYFMHRIQANASGAYSKGIEVHDTKDSAIRSFWGRMKLGYGASDDVTFIHCKITDMNGNVVDNHDLAWNKSVDSMPAEFFMHHIKKDGNNYSKDIDVCANFNVARSSYAAAMEYGYENPQQPDVSYVSCEITDMYGNTVNPFAETWIKPEPEPEPEVEEPAE